MKTKSTIHIDITYLHKYVVYRLFIHGIYMVYMFYITAMVSYKMKYVSDNKKNRYKIRVKTFG